MNGSNFRIRPLERTEINLMLDWAAAEGWNPGLHDGECFYQADPQGFWLGELNGEPIGCISAVAYDERFGFLGLYLVKPQFRGRGFGRQIWKTARDYLGEERNLGLDSVLAQQENYQKSGFQPAYGHIRYEGRFKGQVSPGLVELNTVPWEELINYDRQHFPAERTRFLQHWIEPPEGAAKGIIFQGRLVGYGVIRTCRTGFKVGPLFANEPLYAAELLEGLAAQVSDAPIYLDVPDVNSEAIALAERYRMVPVFSTVRMYTQGIPSVPLEQIFGATTLELG